MKCKIKTHQTSASTTVTANNNANNPTKGEKKVEMKLIFFLWRWFSCVFCAVAFFVQYKLYGSLIK